MFAAQICEEVKTQFLPVPHGGSEWSQVVAWLYGVRSVFSPEGPLRWSFTDVC